MQVLLTTTGTSSPVVLPDLNGREFTHPTVAYDLYTEFSLEELTRSVDLQTAVTAGTVTLTDEYLRPITNVATQLSAVGSGLEGAALWNAKWIEGAQVNVGTQGEGKWLRFVGGELIYDTEGPQGPQGLRGPQGFQGWQGVDGVQGNQGAQGWQGELGPQGFDGTQGNQGWQGTGAQGFQGFQGFQGVGYQGAQGNDGPQGFQGSGFQGAQGSQGWQGWQGWQGTAADVMRFMGNINVNGDFPATPSNGDVYHVTASVTDPYHSGKSFVANDEIVYSTADGDWVLLGNNIVGPQGYQGAYGFQGNQGRQGWQGLEGSQGNQGAQGWQGYGAQGFQGWQGFQGLDGAQGFQGFQGFGYQGAQGNQGWQGTGAQGPQGSQGWQGVIGYQGAQGNQGWQGIGGVQGNQGAQGNQGNQGPESNDYFLIQASRDAFTVNNAYLDYGGTPTNNSPLVLPFNTTLVAMSLATSVAMTWTLEVRLGGVLVVGASLASGGAAKAFATGYAVNFNANDGIQVYSNGLSRYPNVGLWFKRR